MGEKICIHGHFYQPPRENPWTGVIGREHSAAPWHDWNERITDECYLPNAAARILDSQGCIRSTLNNYSRISCDFGPTLLTWLERKRPEVYEKIIRADLGARVRFSGHGCAIAHPYHHLILPLLSRADKVTEVRWGIRDFEDRFGRFPEGMWLPEMGVDTETLAVLADNGISFTLLSPHQGFRTRQISGGPWTTESIDTTVPYLCHVPGGPEMTIFFQDAALSSQVAFGDLLENGDRFADRLLGASPGGCLVHVATDGETFGHHHRFGEMALGWCLDRLESSHPGTLTVYGEYLAENPPVREVEIAERTSWSCPHGVGRWDNGCSCGSGRHHGWSHDWRGPLHRTIRELSILLAEIFAREAGAFFHDPAQARDASIGLLRNSSQQSIQRFFRNHAIHALGSEEQHKALALLEMTWQGLAMQTSCAWFFDDIADREAVQVLRFAARAIQIARDQTGTLPDQVFYDRLSAIPGNRPRYPDGGIVFRDCVLPLVLSADQQAACLALIDSGKGSHILHADAFTGEFLSYGELHPAHDLSLLGRPIRYCCMSTGPDTVLIGLGSPSGQTPEKVSENLLATLKKQGYPAAAKTFPNLFSSVVTLDDLPCAGRRLFLRSRLDRLNRTFLDTTGLLFDHYAEMEGDLLDPRTSPPWLARMARYVLTCRFESMLFSPESSPENLRRMAAAFADREIISTTPGAPHPSTRHLLIRLMEDWAAMPENLDRLETVLDSISRVRNAGAAYPVRDLQDLFITVRDGDARTRPADSRPGLKNNGVWQEKFRTLARILGVTIHEGNSHLQP